MKRTYSDNHPKEAAALRQRLKDGNVNLSGPLSTVKEEIARWSHLQYVSVAAVEAWLDVKSAAEDLYQVAHYIATTNTYPGVLQFEEWDLIVHRCARAFIWAEQLGVLDDQSEEVRREHLEPIRSLLLSFRTEITMFVDAWCASAQPANESFSAAAARDEEEAEDEHRAREWMKAHEVKHHQDDEVSDYYRVPSPGMGY